MGPLLIVNTVTVIVIYNTQQHKKDNISHFFTPSVSMGETVDWTYAICELLDKQGVDLRKEMDERLLEMEEQYRRERQEIDRRFDEQRKVRPLVPHSAAIQFRCTSGLQETTPNRV